MPSEIWELLIAQAPVIIVLIFGLGLIVWLLVSNVNYYRDLTFKQQIALLQVLGVDNAGDIFGEPKKMRFPSISIGVGSDNDADDEL